MRNNLYSFGLFDGVRARVRLKVGDDHVDSAFCSGATIGKHLEGLSNARRIAQIDF
jgi:hypothetical protein